MSRWVNGDIKNPSYAHLLVHAIPELLL